MPQNAPDEISLAQVLIAIGSAAFIIAGLGYVALKLVGLL